MKITSIFTGKTKRLVHLLLLVVIVLFLHQFSLGADDDAYKYQYSDLASFSIETDYNSAFKDRYEYSFEYINTTENN